MAIRRWSILLVTIVLFTLVLPGMVLADPQVTTRHTDGQLSFVLSGRPGIFQEQKPIFYGITTTENVEIRFSATKLVFQGPEQASLDDVEFWVNNRNATFRPGSSLRIHRGEGTHKFWLHGAVTIKAIEDQPAGDYQGTIYITVVPR